MRLVHSLRILQRVHVVLGLGVVHKRRSGRCRSDTLRRWCSRRHPCPAGRRPASFGSKPYFVFPLVGHAVVVRVRRGRLRTSFRPTAHIVRADDDPVAVGRRAVADFLDDAGIDRIAVRAASSRRDQARRVGLLPPIAAESAWPATARPAETLVPWPSTPSQLSAVTSAIRPR